MMTRYVLLDNKASMLRIHMHTRLKVLYVKSTERKTAKYDNPLRDLIRRWEIETSEVSIAHN